MATAEEILQQMEAEANAPVLTIDNDLRTIAIPDDVAILGVESDDDVHRLHFRMPKMCGEFDLSEFKLRVNIMNAGNEPDLYEVKDKAVEGEAITFSWLVGRTAAKYKGDVKFSVCAKLLDKDGVVQQEFNTTPAKLPVLEGLEVSEAVVQLHPDIIEAILLRLSKLETSGGVTDEQIANALSEYLQEHPIEAGATKEQAAQIQKNKEDIEDLKKNGAGQPGQDGQDGKDGVSPTVVITPISGGNRVTITDANGAKTFDVMNGADGKDGQDGADGEPGAAGANGVSPTIGVSAITGGNRITITDANGAKSFDVMNGADGKDGQDGADGSTAEVIDDAASSTEKTYSSSKIDALLNAQKEAIDEQGERIKALEDEEDYSLPTASSSVLGGVKVGNGLAIDANGVLSLNVTNASGVNF